MVMEKRQRELQLLEVREALPVVSIWAVSLTVCTCVCRCTYLQYFLCVLQTLQFSSTRKTESSLQRVQTDNADPQQGGNSTDTHTAIRRPMLLIM